MKKVLTFVIGAIRRIDGLVDDFFADLKHKTAKELLQEKLRADKVAMSERDIAKVSRKIVALACTPR